jgi:hypothetical protein
MAGGFFDTGSLSNHDHTAVPGDGGVLSNLAITGTVSSSGVASLAGVNASGIINAGAGLAITGTGSETVPPSNPTDLSTYQMDLGLSLIGV